MANLIPFNWKKNNVSNSNFDDFSNMLEDFFDNDFLGRRSLRNDSFKLDLEEKEKEYVIEAEIPGVKREEIDLSYNDNRLRIAIKKEENKENKNKNYIHRERRLTSMERSIILNDIDEKEIKAKLDDGILTIIVPKKYKETNKLKINID